MRDFVSQSMRLRPEAADGFTRMLLLSAAAHLVLGVVMAVMPAMRGDVPTEPAIVMTISLGGAPGPRAGGMTPMGGRPVQQAVPETPRARPEAVRPPAAKAPEMTVPEKAAKPAPRSARVNSTTEEARGTTPTRGPREQLGSAVAQTGGQGLGLGLSTGGGGTGGEINIGDFCCPEYLSTLLQLIQRNWNQQQQVSGTTTMRFTIQRDGRMADVQVVRSSGYAALDLASQRALMLTRVPPLPAAYTNPQLTIHLTFEYKR